MPELLGEALIQMATVRNARDRILWVKVCVAPLRERVCKSIL